MFVALNCMYSFWVNTFLEHYHQQGVLQQPYLPRQLVLGLGVNCIWDRVLIGPSLRNVERHNFLFCNSNKELRRNNKSPRNNKQQPVVIWGWGRGLSCRGNGRGFGLACSMEVTGCLLACVACRLLSGCLWWDCSIPVLLRCTSPGRLAHTLNTDTHHNSRTRRVNLCRHKYACKLSILGLCVTLYAGFDMQIDY